MGNVKNLGKGLDDISYLFMSSPEVNLPAKDNTVEPKESSPAALKTTLKSICLVGNNTGFQDAFLVINLALALARLGMRIVIVDMDEGYPCLSFFLGRQIENPEYDNLEELIKDGPRGVKLVGLDKFNLERLSDPEKKRKIIFQLSKMEEDADLILISVNQRNLLNISNLFKELIAEFLILVCPEKEKMLNSYKTIKTIFSLSPLAKIGIIITEVDHMYKIELIYNKMLHAARKFLDKELYKYGFLFKIKKEIDAKTHIASFYDADITACISNIAQIVVLRLNLGDATASAGAFFKRIITDFNRDN